MTTNLSKLNYFYDGTMTRFIDQVVRAFSGFKYVSYPEGIRTENIVPCLPSITDAQVATIISGGTPANLPTLPIIAVTHTGLQDRRNDMQNSTYVRTVTVTERKKVDGQYTGDAGNSYRVDSMMPRPFTMLFDIVVFVSNQDQKYQLLEQILTITYPSFQIQNSDNLLDWSAQTHMTYTGINWSSRAIPVGTSNDIDYTSISYELPIYLNPPARVKARTRIEEVVSNIYEGRPDSDGVIQDRTKNKKIRQIITSPGDCQISVKNNMLTLLNSEGGIYDQNSLLMDWAKLIKLYGSLYPNVSTIRLATTEDIENTSSDIVGTIQYADDISILTFTPKPETLPVDTLNAINGVVNPQEKYPGDGTVPNQIIGQRYLLLDDLTGQRLLWGNVTAHANDIIEFDGSNWILSFSPVVNVANDYVTNLASGRQLKWNGRNWVYTYDGLYPAGYWRIFL